MLREFLGGITLTDLPIVAMVLFLALFAAVLVRVVRRGAGAYRAMAAMPLDADERRMQR